jgi:hypothetical protein
MKIAPADIAEMKKDFDDGVFARQVAGGHEPCRSVK